MKRPMLVNGINVLITTLVSIYLVEKKVWIITLINLGLMISSLFLKKVDKKIKFLILFSIIAILTVSLKTILYIEPIRELNDKKLKVEGQVVEINVSTKGTKNIEVKLEKIEDKKQNIKKKVLIKSYGKDEIKIGDLISGIVDFKLPSNKGYFNAEDYYKSEDIFIIGYSSDIKKIGERFSIIKYLKEVRDNLANSTLSILPGDCGDFINAITLGKKVELREEIRNLFTYTGISHIFALSGLHIGILGSFFLFSLRKLKLKKSSNILTIVFLILYYLMIDFSPSMLRAVIMFIVFMIADLMYRYNDALSSFGIALTIIVLMQPYLIFSVGFMLSFACIFAILVCKRPIQKFLNKVKNKFIRNILFGIFISISIMIFTLPIMSIYFKTVNILSPFLNIIVIPMIYPLVIFGFLMSILSYLNIIILSKFFGLLIFGIYSILMFIVNLYSKYFTFHIMLFEDFLFVLLLCISIILFCYFEIYGFPNKKLNIIKVSMFILILCINIYYIYLMVTPNKVIVLQGKSKEDAIVSVKQDLKNNVVVIDLKDNYSISNLVNFVKNENILSIHTLIILNDNIDRYLLNRLLDFVDVKNIIYNFQSIESEQISDIQSFYNVNFYSLSNIRYNLDKDFIINIHILDTLFYIEFFLNNQSILYTNSSISSISHSNYSFFISPNNFSSSFHFNSVGSSILRWR